MIKSYERYVKLKNINDHSKNIAKNTHWVLVNLNWIIVGKAQNNKNYDTSMQKILKWEFWLKNLPIIANLDFGHIDHFIWR